MKAAGRLALFLVVVATLDSPICSQSLRLLDICPVGSYQSYNGFCYSCPNNCDYCRSSSRCDTCSAGFSLTSSRRCSGDASDSGSSTGTSVFVVLMSIFMSTAACCCLVGCLVCYCRRRRAGVIHSPSRPYMQPGLHQPFTHPMPNSLQFYPQVQESPITGGYQGSFAQPPQAGLNGYQYQSGFPHPAPVPYGLPWHAPPQAMQPPPLIVIDARQPEVAAFSSAKHN